MDFKENMCRLCMRKCSACESLLSKNNIKMIEAVISVKIQDDQILPTIACLNCISRLKLAYEIKLSFLNVNAKCKLRNYNANCDIAVMNSDECCIAKEEPTSCCRNVADTLEQNSLHNNVFQITNVIKQVKSEMPKRICDENATSCLEASEITCAICGIHTSYFDIHCHIQEHFGKQFCDCGVTLDNIELYREHYLNEHSKVAQIWICTLCPLKFQFKSLYNVHVKYAHHEIKKCGKPKKLNRNSKQIFKTNKNTIYKYTCRKCQKSFITREKCWRHLKMHVKCVCPICTKKIESNLLRKHIELHKIVCNICGVQFCDSRSLQTHMLLVHLQTHFCEYCDSKFNSSYDKLMHIRQNHYVN